MVWNLLKKNISPAQITGYAVANQIGLAIVLTALCFYSDMRRTYGDGDSAMNADFMVISKPVPLLAVTGGADLGFDDEEIASLEAQPWVRRVGRFEAADFNVGASIDFNGRGMSTAMFFESVPDEFLDISPDQWQFDPESPSPEIPIILSKDYLALYNFGFAATRGLPQLSEDLISKVPLTVTAVGNGHYDRLPARIVGFSSRLNTIAVPKSYMRWANERYGEPTTRASKPSRLIIEVSSPGDPAIDTYLKRNGMEVAGEGAERSRAVYLATVVTTVVVVIGIVISVLAVFILMLSIYLLIQKSREKLRDLMLLGYSPSQICSSYYRLIGLVNGAVLIGAIGAMLWASSLWHGTLQALNLRAAVPWPAIGVGCLLMALITLINFATIRRLVRRCF